MLLELTPFAEGFALFKPYPRGSAGRGQAFAQHVHETWAVRDTYDYVGGLDTLVARGQDDPDRLGTSGVSYGGFMFSWLMTQTYRFAAAVPLAPVTNWMSEMYTSHIANFSPDFLNDDPHNPQGRFITRLPLHHVSKVKNTPALMVCGARIRTH